MGGELLALWEPTPNPSQEEGSCWRCGNLPPTPPKRRGVATLSTHASKSYKMSPHGTPSLWEGRGGLPVRMALPSHRRGGVGVGSVISIHVSSYLFDSSSTKKEQPHDCSLT